MQLLAIVLAFAATALAATIGARDGCTPSAYQCAGDGWQVCDVSGTWQVSRSHSFVVLFFAGSHRCAPQNAGSCGDGQSCQLQGPSIYCQ